MTREQAISRLIALEGRTIAVTRELLSLAEQTPDARLSNDAHDAAHDVGAASDKIADAINTLNLKVIT